MHARWRGKEGELEGDLVGRGGKNRGEESRGEGWHNRVACMPVGSITD